MTTYVEMKTWSLSPNSSPIEQILLIIISYNNVLNVTGYLRKATHLLIGILIYDAYISIEYYVGSKHEIGR